MKDKAVISNDLVNDIFYKIPEIHIHHTVFICTDSPFEYLFAVCFSLLGFFNISFPEIISMG